LYSLVAMITSPAGELAQELSGDLLADPERVDVAVSKW